MSGPYFAHSLRGKPREAWQSLQNHAMAVAEMAAGFAEPFGSRDWGRIAGLLHDVGKAHPDFQAYLCRENGLDASEYDGDGTGNRINHSGPGAALALEKWPGLLGKTLAYIVAGHHAGLPDWHGVRDSLPHRLQDANEDLEKIRARLGSVLECLPVLPKPPDFALRCTNQKATAFHFWVRMVFSCLVDADFLDTEAFMDPERQKRRPTFPALTELKGNFDRELERLMTEVKSKSPGKRIDVIRASILSACRKAAAGGTGFYSLTVPTGGGKTLSGTAFALDHAVFHGKRRVIYVIPYTSIIEQTADVLRRFLGNDHVVEHHSNIAAEREADNPSLTLAAENWDAPVVVTTNVQFFESLFTAKPGRSRKLHNLVESVVILDEAQLLPPKWLDPCVEALNHLVDEYGATVVFSTATQPALDGLSRQPFPIIPDPATLYRELKRTEIRMPENLGKPVDWPSLASELEKHPQVLCVVNRRRDCYDLWKAMPPATVHLSALMCGAHRSRVIRLIKDRLAAGESIRVVSTQLVEAGVDLDFPVVFRALAGLDSINQAAGRCNREGRLGCLGKVQVFVPPTFSPPGMLAKGENVTREMSALPGFIPDDPEVFPVYFRHFYARVNDLGGSWLDELLVKDVNSQAQPGSLQFRTAGAEFRLIDEYAVPVVVNFDGNESLISRLRFGGPTRETMRALQRYVVTVSPAIARRLLAEGFVEELSGGILVQVDSTLYHDDIGLDIHREAYEPEDLVL